MCEFRNQCRYFDWLKTEHPETVGDDCWKNPYSCSRLNPRFPHFTLVQYGPITTEEITFVYKRRLDENDNPAGTGPGSAAMWGDLFSDSQIDQHEG